MSMTKRTPKAIPGAVAATCVVCLLFIAFAVLAIHDLASSQGWTSGRPWTGSVVQAVDGLNSSTVWVIAGALIALLGGSLTVLALMPARTTHRPSPVAPDVWVSDGALQTMVVDAAEETPGVAGAKARIRRSRIVIDIRSDVPAVEHAVEVNVQRRMDRLSTKPLTIKSRQVNHES